MDGEKERYRLYIMNSDKHGYAEAAAQKYSRIKNGYVLIYATEQPQMSAELTEPEIQSLPQMDKEWIDRCNKFIIRDYVSEHQDLLGSSQKKFLEDFERELEKERRKLETAYGNE